MSGTRSDGDGVSSSRSMVGGRRVAVVVGPANGSAWPFWILRRRRPVVCAYTHSHIYTLTQNLRTHARTYKTRRIHTNNKHTILCVSRVCASDKQFSFSQDPRRRLKKKKDTSFSRSRRSCAHKTDEIITPSAVFRTLRRHRRAHRPRSDGKFGIKSNRKKFVRPPPRAHAVPSAPPAGHRLRPVLAIRPHYRR